MASSFLGLSSNISVLSVPLYYGLCILPHAYAITTASRGNIAAWDNRNPRASGLKDQLKTTLSADEWARYERAEAAHYNGLESFPLFAAAVVLGNIARLPIDDLNNFAIGLGLLRAVYTVAYVTTKSQSLTWLRSGLWFGMLGWSMKILWVSGKSLA